MDRTRQRELAESLFDRIIKRESDTDSALTEEQAEHAAVVKNMQRLRALRLSRKAKMPLKQC
jgi:predicted protein tyrosine phosphatase